MAYIAERRVAQFTSPNEGTSTLTCIEKVPRRFTRESRLKFMAGNAFVSTNNHLFVEADVAAGRAAIVHFLLVVIVEVVVILVGFFLLALVLTFLVVPRQPFLQREGGTKGGIAFLLSSTIASIFQRSTQCPGFELQFDHVGTTGGAPRARSFFHWRRIQHNCFRIMDHEYPVRNDGPIVAALNYFYCVLPNSGL